MGAAGLWAGPAPRTLLGNQDDEVAASWPLSSCEKSSSSGSHSATEELLLHLGRASCPGVTTEEPGGGCEQAGGGFQQIPHLSQTGPLNRIQDSLLSSFLYFLFDFLGI